MADSQYKFKEVLHAFCGRKKLPPPSYALEDEEGEFYCEVGFTYLTPSFSVCTNQLRVQGYDFVASGEAVSKADAQKIAAKAFCDYLIAQKQLQPHELV